MEVNRFGGIQVLRFLEQEKMATEQGFTPSVGDPEAGAAEPAAATE